MDPGSNSEDRSRRRDQVIAEIRHHRAELERLGVRRLRLFGSVARGEDFAQSDIDVLVDFGAPPSFDRYMDVKIFLEDLLECRVDLITESGLREAVRPYVEAEAVLVA